MEPFNVIYQSAEDGMGDTIKPRLMDAGADLDRVLSIVEDKKQLSLLDERIEKAIREHNARLMILDPIQGYIGNQVDMNRANEIRTVLKSVSSVAERTGCAIVLIGRLKSNPNVRIIVHDKSSLAPEGKSLAFGLGDAEGFRWLDGYEGITSEELLCGFTAETKTATAEELIRSMLAGGREIMAEEVFRTADGKGISRRTVNEAKKAIPDIVTRKNGKYWFWSLP